MLNYCQVARSGRNQDTEPARVTGSRSSWPRKFLRWLAKKHCAVPGWLFCHATAHDLETAALAHYRSYRSTKPMVPKLLSTITSPCAFWRVTMQCSNVPQKLAWSPGHLLPGHASLHQLPQVSECHLTGKHRSKLDVDSRRHSEVCRGQWTTTVG